jgi:hypothetical protein
MRFGDNRTKPYLSTIEYLEMNMKHTLKIRDVPPEYAKSLYTILFRWKNALDVIDVLDIARRGDYG